MEKRQEDILHKAGLYIWTEKEHEPRDRTEKQSHIRPTGQNPLTIEEDHLIQTQNGVVERHSNRAITGQ